MSEEENINNGNEEQAEGTQNDDFLVSVFKTENMAIVAVIKSILDEAEIKYMAKGDNMQGVLPINAFPVDFQVMPEDEEYAKELLKDIDEESDWYDENSPDDDDVSGEDKPSDENV